MKDISNILIRNVSEEDREALRRVMQETGVNQASKAVMKAVHAFGRNASVIKLKDERIRSLERQVSILKELLKLWDR